jgi:hypothetical protein
MQPNSGIFWKFELIFRLSIPFPTKLTSFKKLMRMKKFVMLGSVLFTTLIAISQTKFQNSKWKIHTDVPRAADLQYQFAKDTLTVFNESGDATQSMLFSQQQDTLYLRMLSPGASPCSVGAKGWYKIIWQENGKRFLLKSIKDDCSARINRLTNMQVIQRVN